MDFLRRSFAFLKDLFPAREDSTDISARLIGVFRHKILTDSNSITTLVAFHGCPLRCKHCPNPQCHEEADKFRSYTPEELYEEITGDEFYFRATCGGITFTGGEPLMHPDFIIRFRELCGDDIRICVETSLNVPQENAFALATVVDEWVVDLKASDEAIYREYTGKEFSPVIRTLLHLTTDYSVSKDRILLLVPENPTPTTEVDVFETAQRFKRNGYTRFENSFTRRELSRMEHSLIPNLESGKSRREILKLIRRDIAKQNGLALPERKCIDNDCEGTCARCEDELKTLNELLENIKQPNLKISLSLFQHISALRKGEPYVQPAKRPESVFPKVIYAQKPGSNLPKAEKLKHDSAETDGCFKRIYFKECHIAGVSYHLRYDDPIWDKLYEGAKLGLVRHRKNTHDSNAIAVVATTDYKGDPDDYDFENIIGYIPRNSNTEIAVMMDDGYADNFEVEITSFKRQGHLNDRIRITIWLLSEEAEPVSPDTLRMQSLSSSECRSMVEDLQRLGTVHFRWGGFPPRRDLAPKLGEEVVIVGRHQRQVAMFRMKVIAVGEDAASFVDNPEDTVRDDDCISYILANISGPVFVNLYELNFLNVNRIGHMSVFTKLDKKVSDELKLFFDRRCNRWLLRSFAEPDPISEVIDEVLEFDDID